MKDCQTLNPINLLTLISCFLIKKCFSRVGFLPHRGRGTQLWMEIYNNIMYVVCGLESIKRVLFFSWN